MLSKMAFEISRRKTHSNRCKKKELLKWFLGVKKKRKMAFHILLI